MRTLQRPRTPSGRKQLKGQSVHWTPAQAVFHQSASLKREPPAGDKFLNVPGGGKNEVREEKMPATAGPAITAPVTRPTFLRNSFRDVLSSMNERLSYLGYEITRCDASNVINSLAFRIQKRPFYDRMMSFL